MDCFLSWNYRYRQLSRHQIDIYQAIRLMFPICIYFQDVLVLPFGFKLRPNAPKCILRQIWGFLWLGILKEYEFSVKLLKPYFNILDKFFCSSSGQWIFNCLKSNILVWKSLNLHHQIIQTLCNLVVQN